MLFIEDGISKASESLHLMRRTKPYLDSGQIRRRVVAEV
jgi:hypothetical protein